MTHRNIDRRCLRLTCALVSRRTVAYLVFLATTGFGSCVFADVPSPETLFHRAKTHHKTEVTFMDGTKDTTWTAWVGVTQFRPLVDEWWPIDVVLFMDKNGSMSSLPIASLDMVETPGSFLSMRDIGTIVRLKGGASRHGRIWGAQINGKEVGGDNYLVYEDDFGWQKLRIDFNKEVRSIQVLQSVEEG